MRFPGWTTALATIVSSLLGASLLLGNVGCGSSDPLDPDGGAGMDADLPLPPNAAVYAHTATALHRVNYETLEVTKVADFGGAFMADTMTDLAMDSTGVMIGISFTQVYRIDPLSATTTLIGSATLQQAFNGLSFVPSQLALGVAGPDVLVASRNSDGRIFQIDTASGAVSQLGDMGAYRSSGDIVGVHGFGMVATVIGPGTTGDILVRLAPGTFAATPIGTTTGVTGIWGMGYWKQRLFGFTSTGAFVEMDPTTGAATPIRTTTDAWFGAAVTTAAPNKR
jgi:hypothetical protein